MNILVHEKSSVRLSAGEPLFREMRALLSGLLRPIDQHGSIVLHLTAARGGEGTTTIARALAACAAQSQWCKVALLDANRSLVCETTELPLPGMVDVFAETGQLAIRRLDLGGAEFGIGRLNSSGPFLPKVEAVRALYQRLRREFALTIIDTPPVLEARDTAALAALADGTMLVVASEQTRIAEVRRAQVILEQLGASVLGVVLNKRRRHLPGVLDRMA